MTVKEEAAVTVEVALVTDTLPVAAPGITRIRAEVAERDRMTAGTPPALAEVSWSRFVPVRVIMVPG